MTPIEVLQAIEEIKQLKARYFECTDWKDWDGLRECLAPDIAFEQGDTFAAADPRSGASRVYGRPELLAKMPTEGWAMKGRDAIVDNGARQFADISTVHRGFDPQIMVHSLEEASGKWGMTDILRFPPGGPITEIRGYGHYDDRYGRLDGRWVIQATTVRRLRIDVI